MNLLFEAFPEISGDDGANGRDKKEEADGIGKEAGGDEDGTGEEDHEAVHCFTGGHASFVGGLLEFEHGATALGLGEGGSEDGGDENDGEGVSQPKLITKGDKEIELGHGDEDEEDEKFSKHGLGGKGRWDQ